MDQKNIEEIIIEGLGMIEYLGIVRIGFWFFKLFLSLRDISEIYGAEMFASK